MRFKKKVSCKGRGPYRAGDGITQGTCAILKDEDRAPPRQGLGRNKVLSYSLLERGVMWPRR